MLDIVDAMHRSVLYWIKARYRQNPPKIAQDDLPADEMADEMRRLVLRWQSKFDELAPKLAEYFAQQIADRSDAQLSKILSDAGIIMTLKLTPTMRDVLAATVARYTGLIRSIPQRYLADVEQDVMDSVQTGRDLSTLVESLQTRYGSTRKRAQLIALHQNNAATSALTKARQVDLGIEKGIWRHSRAGKEPRPTHVRNDGQVFDIRQGWLDPAVGERIMPGELINCRCFWTPVIEGI